MCEITCNPPSAEGGHQAPAAQAEDAGYDQDYGDDGGGDDSDYDPDYGAAKKKPAKKGGRKGVGAVRAGACTACAPAAVRAHRRPSWAETHSRLSYARC